jgi:hyperosmotically inducible periplasmic protein
MRTLSFPLVPTTTAIALAATMGLAACGKQAENRTAGQNVDAAVATVEKKTEQAASDVKEGMASARDAVGKAVEATADTVKDAAITAAINAELARDSALSAIKVNVDTNTGKVLLRGTAPTAVAREKATELAKKVDGVVSVDNQLQVGGS